MRAFALMSNLIYLLLQLHFSSSMINHDGKYLTRFSESAYSLIYLNRENDLERSGDGQGVKDQW